MLVYQGNPLGVELFSHVNAIFSSSKLAQMLATWVKTLYYWFASDVTAAMLLVKNKSMSSPLGTKLYFHVNFSSKISIVLTPNMAALSRGCKPRIGSLSNDDCDGNVNGKKQ